jgi:protein TonB
MFEQLVESSARKSGNRWAYFLVTAVIWLAVLTTAIVVGIFAYDARLNEQFEQLTLLAPAPPPPPPPPPPPAAPAQKVTKVIVPEGFVAAKEPPKTIKPPSATPPVFNTGGVVGGQVGGVIGGVVGGVTGGTVGGVGPAEPPPPPPPPPPKEEPKPPPQVVRKSGGVLQGLATRRVEPTYPPLAKAARVMGSVVVEVTIDENGNVISASAVSGHPLLKDAAVAAARGWKFQPTKLSGQPVKVIGTITFNFQM